MRGANKMTDLFDEMVFCSKCGKKVSRELEIKNGFKIRSIFCMNCKKRIYHPVDVEEYRKFTQLRQRPFAVKLRMVGHSYVVSIPREIIDFQEDQVKQTSANDVNRDMNEVRRNMERTMVKQIETMTKMVSMCLEAPGRLAISFNEQEKDSEKLNKKYPIPNRKNKIIEIKEEN
jgi:hypothetical protein